MSRLPDVDAAALTAVRPETFVEGSSVTFMMAGASPLKARQLQVSEGFAKAMNIRLLSGHWWSSNDAAANRRPLVIDEELARSWGGSTAALGKEVTDPEGFRYVIVGVTASFRRYFSPNAKDPIALCPLEGATSQASVVFRLRPGQPDERLMHIHEALRRLAPRSRIDLRKHDFPVRHQPDEEVMVSMVAALLALLGAISVGGAFWLEVTRRTSELGLRRALGASATCMRRQIRTEVIVQALWASVLGASALFHGVLLYLCWQHASTGRPIRSQDFGFLVELPIAAVLLLVLVLAASWFPARRAARIQPIAALRHG